MTGKEITTERKMHNVARELAADLRKKLACFGGYCVAIEPDKTQDRVYVTGKYPVDIITKSAFGYVMDIVTMYSETYSGGSTCIDWHIGQTTLDGKVTGAIVACIMKNNKIDESNEY